MSEFYRFFSKLDFLEKHFYLSLFNIVIEFSTKVSVFYAYLFMLKNLIPIWNIMSEFYHFCPLRNKHLIPSENYMFFNVDFYSF